MTEPVVIVGGGFAGVAAAWAVARSGGSAVVVADRAGASELYSGICDGEARDAGVVELAQSLGVTVAPTLRAVATREGMIRRVYARDSALLDLEAHAGKQLGVVDPGRDEWDGELLARSLSATTWARSTGTSFRCVAVSALKSGAERRMAPYDFACLLETSERSAELARLLGQLVDGIDALLFGPWLGVESDLARRLSNAVGRPVGETASAPGGVAGARFARRRTAVLAANGVEFVNQAVRAVEERGSGLSVVLEDGTALSARAVVLAIGGIVAGGLRVTGVGAGPAASVSLAVPAALELEGEIVDRATSLMGQIARRGDFEPLDAIGLVVDARFAASAGLPLYACGDALAGKPRTVLGALSSGLAAGRGAVGVS